MSTQTITQTSLTIRGARTAGELHRATMLMTATHRLDSTVPCDWLESYGGTYPHFKREHTRIALYCGELAGVLRVSTDTVRIGEARLKMGGLGWISIAPRLRNRNVQPTLIANTLEYLREHRYHIAMLFPRLQAFETPGFVGAVTDYRAHLDCTKLNWPRFTRRARLVKPGDIGALQRIQSSNATGIASSILRERGHFANQWEQFKTATVITDAHGRIEGYMLIRGGIGRLHIDEAEALSNAAHTQLIAHAIAVARERLMSHITVYSPPDHPMQVALSAKAPPQAVQYGTELAGLVHIADLNETLESMIPEWESRISRSLLREMKCEVTLLIDHQPYRVRVHYGAVDIALQTGKNKFSLDQGDFAQLLTGYHDAKELWSQERRLITREARALLEVLFPKRNPYMPLFDRF